MPEQTSIKESRVLYRIVSKTHHVLIYRLASLVLLGVSKGSVTLGVHILHFHKVLYDHYRFWNYHLKKMCTDQAKCSNIINMHLPAKFTSNTSIIRLIIWFFFLLYVLFD
ncbi:hypothetical protein J3Q64DRAFT_1250190 [Phycomyces blakesleeanus]|uniref:Uncharacterized protein n=1 Tax=Phycomyces blakesleeanus TaxID=4837 RepID=A0ABR3ARE3_PHYBL